MTVTVLHGDMLEVLPPLAAESIDAVCTDPPYGLSFMSKAWDRSVPGVEYWREVYRVLKPGAHIVAFGGARTFHRMAVAIEDAGFEIRDMLAWMYSCGFPKSHNIASAIDKSGGVAPRGKAFNMKGRGGRAEELDANGREFLGAYEPATEAAREWSGWGTALKPAIEPIILARKPLGERTIAANVLRHGTGAINVDACRVDGGHRQTMTGGMARKASPVFGKFNGGDPEPVTTDLGRWPPNVLHDGSPEVLEAFGRFGESASIASNNRNGADTAKSTWGLNRAADLVRGHTDTGSAASFFPELGYGGEDLRFFYGGKAGPDDRLESSHPTVKPIALMRWLVRLITPPGGTVLDCFAGAGTTGAAAIREGFDAILVEREAQYVTDIKARLEHIAGGDTPLFASAY